MKICFVGDERFAGAEAAAGETSEHRGLPKRRWTLAAMEEVTVWPDHAANQPTAGAAECEHFMIASDDGASDGASEDEFDLFVKREALHPDGFLGAFRVAPSAALDEPAESPSAIVTLAPVPKKAETVRKVALPKAKGEVVSAPPRQAEPAPPGLPIWLTRWRRVKVARDESQWAWDNGLSHWCSTRHVYARTR